MKADGKLGAWDTAGVIEEATRYEQAGYDGLWASESAHDPFLPLLLAAEHTERIEVGTAIAVLAYAPPVPPAPTPVRTRVAQARAPGARAPPVVG